MSLSGCTATILLFNPINNAVCSILYQEQSRQKTVPEDTVRLLGCTGFYKVVDQGQIL